MNQYEWLGGDGAFTDQNQWEDLSTQPPQNPALQPPSSGDDALIDTNGGGTISGTGDVLGIQINGVDVTFTGNITVSEGLTVDEGANLDLPSGAMVDVGESVLDVLDGSTSTIAATVDGGSVIVDGSDLQVASGGALSLTAGAGDLLLDDAATLELMSGGTIGDTVGFIEDGTVTVTGGIWSSASGMAVGVLGSGMLAISGGGTVSTGNDGGLVLGSFGGDTGTVTVSGSGSVLQSDQTVASVGGMSSGDLEIDTGGAANIQGTLDVGTMSGADGTVVVTGSGSTLSVGDALMIGDGGDGTGMLGSGAAASVTNGVTIGNQDGASGTLTVTDSNTQLSVDGGAVIGASGDGELDVQSGAGIQINSGSVVVGAAQGGTGTVTVSGGSSTLSAGNGVTIGAVGSGTLAVQSGATVSLTGGTLDLGTSPDATGVVALSGSGSALTLVADPAVIGDAGAGTLTIGSGALFDNSSGTTTIGGDIGGVGTLAVAGGSAQANLGALVIGGPSDGTLSVGASGTVTTKQDITIAAGTMSLSLLSVSGTGASLSDGGNLVVGEAGDGNLIVQSTGSVGATSGSLVIGDTKGSTGDVELGGSLEIGQGITVGNAGDGTLDIQANGSLTLDDGTIDIGAAMGGTGTLALAANGVSLTAPGALIVGDSGTGTLQVTAGTSLDASAGTLTIGSASDGVGLVTVSGADAAASLGGLLIGATGDGTLAIDSGATVTTSDTVTVGQDGDGFGTLTLNGDSTSFIDGGDLLVGASGDGTVSVQGGATLEVNSGAVMIGGADDSSGVVTVAGTDTPLQMGKDLTVGQSGDGTLDVQAGVTLDVNSGTVTAGAMKGGSGEIILAGTGSVFAAGQDMTVGSAGDGTVDVGAGAGLAVTGSLDVGAMQGGTGTITLDGSQSALTAQADVTVGDSGTGVVSIADGGSLDVSSGTLTIGAADGGVGTVAATGTDAAATLDGLVVGDTGKGTLTLDSGAQVTTSDDVVIGNSAGGSGSVTVNGDGTLLDDGGGLIVGAAGSGEIDINQGSVEVFSGAVTLGQSETSSGSLSLKNASLDLSGSLVIGEVGSGSLEVGAAGTLNAQDITLGAVTNGSGNLLVDGVGATAESSDLTVGADGTGALEVSAKGSLQTTGQAILGADSLPTEQQQASILGQATWSVGTGLIVGEATDATMTIDSGGEVGAGSVVLGDQSDVTGIVTVDGTIGTSGGGSVASTLLFGGELVVGNSGIAELDVSGGGVVGSPSTPAGTIEIGAQSGGSGSVSVADTGSSVNAAVLAVGGSGAAAGGAGTLSIGAGATVAAGTVTVWSSGTIALGGGVLVTDPITVGGEVVGTGTIAGGIVDNGVIAVDDGTLTLSGGIGGSGALAFDGLATLVLGTPGSGLSQAVTGLDAGDRIELTGLDITKAQVTSPGTVTVSTSGASYVLNDVSFAPGAPMTFATGNDTTTGNDYIQVQCFAAGTRIAGPRGEVAVEALRVGDSVALADGGVTDVVWIGRRTVDAARHPAPRKVWPVRVAASAFGAGQPHRELFLSPDHAVFIENVLIPVKRLINGSTIVQVQVDRVTYYHIELPRHDVVLAEGLPVESYLDTGDRSDFANGGGPVRLHPDFNVLTWEALGCARLVMTGPELDAARARLAAIAVHHSSRHRYIAQRPA